MYDQKQKSIIFLPKVEMPYYSMYLHLDWKKILNVFSGLNSGRDEKREEEEAAKKAANLKIIDFWPFSIKQEHILTFIVNLHIDYVLMHLSSLKEITRKCVIYNVLFFLNFFH